MERTILPEERESRDFIKWLEMESGTEISLCYQCGKCTAGCPVSFAMDHPPRQIIRLLQLGLIEHALRSESIWLCASCETCSSRCPRGVEIAKVMDALRREALKRRIRVDKDVAAFNETFLSSVKRYGRVHEAGLVIEYNLKIRKPLKDAQLGPQMLVRGKLKMLPEVIKGSRQVREIFARIRQAGGDHK